MRFALQVAYSQCCTQPSRRERLFMALDIDHSTSLTLSPQGKATILVMDDDHSMQKLFSIMLEVLGYDSVCVNEGATAIALYEAAHSIGHPYAFVILDVHNRLGMGGTDTLVSLRAVDPQVKVIVCSADHNDPAMVSYLQYGFRAALAKPFGLQTLREILQQLS